MKIAFIITGLGMGGAENQVSNLASHLSKRGFKLKIIYLTGQIEIQTPKEVDLIGLKITKNITSLLRGYIAARAIIKKEMPDVVHSHMVHANLFARLLRLTTSIPRLICTAHSSNEGGPSRMVAYRLTDRLCELSTNVSQEAVDIFIKHKVAPAHRIIAVHNGIDTTRFIFNPASRIQLRSELGVSDKTPLLLAVGRLTAAKDYPNLLAAFSQLPMTYAHAQLVIIGTGEEEGVLKEIVHSLKLTGRVHFLGLRQDVADWMSAADVFVLSSAWEGFGLVVAEAMSCQRVVVATDCGGVREVVGEAGLLVPPKQSGQLAEALVCALNMDATERAKIGSAARQRIVEHYSLDAAAQRWLDIYQGKSC